MDLRDIKEFLKDTFKYIITIIIVLVIFIYGISIQQIVGNSMRPTYNDQELVILKKFYYKLFDVKRFDVVSLKYDESKYLVKRIIGLPGEEIQYKDNKLYVNGVVVEEEFLVNVETENFKVTQVVPEDHYFVLGDNRSNSLDSREIGFISKDDIIGKVNFRFWPLNKVSYVK